MLTSDSKTVSSINYSIIGITAFVALIGLLAFIIWLCLSVKQLPEEEKDHEKPINYTYHDETNPPYELYKKS